MHNALFSFIVGLVMGSGVLYVNHGRTFRGFRERRNVNYIGVLGCVSAPISGLLMLLFGTF